MIKYFPLSVLVIMLLSQHSINVNANICSPNPCKNGGGCTPIGTSFQCSCRTGCYGFDCSYCATKTTVKTTTTVPVCSSNPCKNGGTCKALGSSFQCTCPSNCLGFNCAYCQKSLVTKKSLSTCVDKQANCVYWANYCNLLSSPNPCPKTCKLC